MRSMFVDDINGQTVYRCKFCKYDTFDRARAEVHFPNAHGVPNKFGALPHGLPETDISLEDWVIRERANPRIPGVRLGIGFLTWNTREASTFCARAIAAECHRLRALGVIPAVYWSDNGSTDGTIDAVTSELFHAGGIHAEYNLFKDNMGQTIARNAFIDESVAHGDDYLLMVDGDVEIIPYSSYALTMALHARPVTDCCLGMYTYNCTPVWDDDVALDCRRIEPWMVTEKPEISWTNFGVFRNSMFADGIRFDESPAFRGAGWGFEDDDLYLQMKVKGLHSYNTNHFRFLHRPRNSSIRIMGTDVALAAFDRRKAYMLEKWKGEPLAAWHRQAISATQLPIRKV